MLNLSDKNKIKETENDNLVFKTLTSPKAGIDLAKMLLLVGSLFILGLFLPWQQNIRGTGSLTAFHPGNRSQTIESAIAGRIASWNIIEGQFVEKGDTILTLTEVKEKFFDPELLLRLEEQIDAKESSINSKENKILALKDQIQALNEGLVAKEAQARNKLIQSRYKLASDSADFVAEQVRVVNAESQYNRNRQLYDFGNIALSKFQDFESKFEESKAKVASAENKYLESSTEVINARVNIAATQAEYQDKISKASSDLNNTMAEVFDGQGELAKANNEFVNMTIRNEQYQIIAPQNGYLVKALRAGIGETIKEGEAVATIMPDISDMAVEMTVRAMDVPLIEAGRKVRIQFDGWPALQFSGWPNVSVGTFGGLVQVIDRVDDTVGNYRILVTPDPNDEPWPEQLRMGSGTKGWVMLDNVKVGYEIWRQLNGFPPSLYEAPESNDKGAKAAKK
ncbi:MAG: multidrug efflux pump subunit AcrA (membrane-fusion protein) [Roseivirga sp.]|jgi:multidrug efflux pump subunit AcrA (membrane-fusion protein)